MCDIPALRDMEVFVRQYLDPKEKLRILEVGSRDVNGTFRIYFDNPNWEYIGLDLVKGPGVDIVSLEPYRYPFDDCSFDLIVSGQTIEHVEDTHQFMREIGRLIKPGGLVYVSAPHDCEEHRFPIDCWRIFPDGMRFLFAKIAGLQVLDARKTSIHCVGIGKKPYSVAPIVTWDGGETADG